MTTPQSPKHALVTVQTAAKRMRVDVETVRRWCRKQEVQAVLTPGGRGQWRIWVDNNGVVVRT